MTVAPNVAILTALMTRLTAPALTSPATAVASPLVAYTPTPGVKYIKAHPIMRADPQDFGVGFDSSVIHRGIFQVDAVMPEGAGEAPGLTLAGLIAARFPRGLELVAGGYRLRMLSTPTIATAVTDAPWVRYPVSIPYQIIT